jgi:hypothetical protein
MPPFPTLKEREFSWYELRGPVRGVDFEDGIELLVHGNKLSVGSF